VPRQENPGFGCESVVTQRTTGDELEARIAEVEIKLSYSEDLIETLNTTVYRQQLQIEQLVQEIRILREEKRNEEGRVGQRNIRDDIPPHY
jgi:SlyX protein